MGEVTDIIGDRDGIVVLVPARDLDVVDAKQPDHERNEVSELFGLVGRRVSEKRSR